jgi:diguanylate cyclase
MTAFLHRRQLLRPTRFIVAFFAAFSSLPAISNLVTQSQMSSGLILLSVVSAVFAVAMAGLWLTHWPTRWQSEIAAIAAAATIASWSAVQPSPGLSALACSALAVTGGYFAFFHNSRSLVLNTGIAVAAAAVAALKLRAEADLTAALAAFWIVLFLNVSVPVAVRGMALAMGTLANRADEDGLTKLLNRRGFTHVVSRMLYEEPSSSTHDLVLILADIDNFKRINDTYGHAAGDELIRKVADILRAHSPPDAALCRSGGEEFLIAVKMARPALPLADDIRAAIAELPIGVTASIGVVHSDLLALSNTSAETLVTQLIAVADGAMYAAKRSGGNAVRHV